MGGFALSVLVLAACPSGILLEALANESLAQEAPTAYFSSQ